MDALTVAIEFAIGLAGFSGIVFVLIGKSEVGEWNNYRNTSLLQFAFSAAFLCFAAILLNEALGPVQTWTYGACSPRLPSQVC